MTSTLPFALSTLLSKTPTSSPCDTIPPEDGTYVETAVQDFDIKDDNWIQKLLEVDKDQLTLIIGHLANKGNIDNRSIKRARTQLPSFAAAKWADFAAEVGLPEIPRHLPLEYFQTPVYQLPPSFHKAAFESSWHTQDVYQEAGEQTTGESGIRILDPVCK
jgi:hypothetical protein